MVSLPNNPLKGRAAHMPLPEFAKYIPMRLSQEERNLLNILENTLHVSEYTDHVDVTSARRGIKSRRVLDGISEVLHIATGLAVASGHERSLLSEEAWKEVAAASNSPAKILFRRKKHAQKKKKKHKKKEKNGNKSDHDNDVTVANGDEDTNNISFATRDPRDNAVLFQTMFEVGRRNKVLNPNQMRTTYGKLMYMLQDSQSPTVAKSIGFSLHKDMVLVAPYLAEHGAADILHDNRLIAATKYIRDRDGMTGERLDRKIVEQAVAEKCRLAQELVEEYAERTQLTADDVQRCIDSISDAIAYVEANVAPVEQMLDYLEENFHPSGPREGFSLELRGSKGFSSSSFGNYGRYGLSAFGTSGSEGPTLSHSHSTQYVFVWQSLRLWAKVMRNMHKLWICADDDLLSTNASYNLCNTGQGLNRVQQCPKVRKIMGSLLHATQQEAGQAWVGLSVVHLGDRDVPNALVFIDKYTQIPRFLAPIVSFIHSIPELCRDERIHEYICDVFGSKERLKLEILTDYFKHGFDGSGDDGGSCIDGRLTSSWNWTSRIAKKKYYPALMMSGFQGFDGDFK
ncbi:DUF2009 domain containing protein [Nitzschia inconspicua]|uniref:DUF2009 domain containing protein n=1 Tax=Nitzschia inconspicua TaxID=303405 RepID=A0A9K3LG40_9STRA|nr:DUF2009 domain containing protein [Nitzschia inconspicua]